MVAVKRWRLVTLNGVRFIEGIFRLRVFGSCDENKNLVMNINTIFLICDQFINRGKNA